MNCSSLETGQLQFSLNRGPQLAICTVHWGEGDTRGAAVAAVEGKATTLCAGHAQQLGGESPPPNLMEVKGSDDARATTARWGLKEAWNKCLDARNRRRVGISSSDVDAVSKEEWPRWYTVDGSGVPQGPLYPNRLYEPHFAVRVATPANQTLQCL